MLGLLTYLPTTAYFPQYFFIAVFLYVLIRDRGVFLDAFSQFQNNSSHKLNWNFLIIILIILLSTINRLIHWDSVKTLGELFPYFLLLIPTYIIAIRFRKVDAIVLILLVAFESLFTIAQWKAGVSTFDTSLEGFVVFGDSELAYFQRPLGLSLNSSNIASKMLLSWLLIDFFRLRSWKWNLIKGLILFGVYVTFNRSVIMALAFYLIFSNIQSFLSLRYKLENAVVGLIATITGLAGVGMVIFYKGQEIINQFTRNQGKVELTGREHIWQDFLLFIQEHLVYGNNSIKLWMNGYHAHNSFIELIATNGVFISFVYFTLVYRNIKLSNWVFVTTIFVFGLTQYAFFWGISLADIVLWVFLFQIVEQPKTNPSWQEQPVRV